ncbi:MAG: RtcB family protein [Leptospirales bacterium]|nr:RtcB family protein [Leptospirales bacterium]
MIDTLSSTNVQAQLWIPLSEVEESAQRQIRNIASMPWCARLAIMPDVHFGKGATVGSVIAMRGAVSPAAVGVDIGCGMCALPSSLKISQLPDSLRALRNAIEGAIPVGFESHPENRQLPRAFRSGSLQEQLYAHLQKSAELDRGVASLRQRLERQAGTLGGGNHFIELCADQAGGIWLLLHSGSRNIGKSLAEIHIARARELIHNQSLPDRDLAVFLAGTPEMESYRSDLNWAQEYARWNRTLMVEYLKDILCDLFPGISFGEMIQCHHNYLAEEMHFGEELFVTRKGAISAQKGQFGIIPGSMGARSFVVRGLGNADSMHSASHGAGRRMSRGEAKRRFNQDDLLAQTAGIECRKDAGVVDEIPGAYKDIDQVMERQRDLVEVFAELKQLLCVKG